MRTRRSKQQRKRNNMKNKTWTNIVIMLIMVFSISMIFAIVSDHKTNTDMPQQWIPTIEDIAYQDSMWTIINQTSLEVDTIRESIDHIIDRLDEMQ